MQSFVSTVRLLLAIFFGASINFAAIADPVEDFYKGKQIRLIIGTQPGGTYDAYGRLFAAHVSRHIPGNPTVAVSNMPGASGMKAAGYLYSVAPRDGTTIAVFNNDMGQRQILEPEAASQFDVTRFTWIGAMSTSVSIFMTYHTSGVKTVEDAKAKEVTIGALSTAGGNYIYPQLLNRFYGTKFKSIIGYEGGTAIMVAMERGEVDGRGSIEWTGYKANWPHWIKENKAHVLMQIALVREPDLPDVPLLIELAKSPEQAAVYRLLSSGTNIAFPVIAPPQLDPAKAAALRKAFEDTMKDPLFLAEAEKRGLPIIPLAGAEVQKNMEEIVATPREVVNLLKQVIEETVAATQKK